MTGTTLTKREIAQHLKALGVQPAMTLMVHSSLSALGQVEGGADAVIDALLEVIGPQGTLLMPTHPARDGRTFDRPAPAERLRREPWRCRPVGDGLLVFRRSGVGALVFKAVAC